MLPSGVSIVDRIRAWHQETSDPKHPANRWLNERRAPRIFVNVLWIVSTLVFVCVSPVLHLRAAAGYAVAWSRDSSGRRLVCTLGLVALALVLYAVRRYRRIQYGFLEMAFAVAAAWFAFGQVDSSTDAAFATLLGAAYVFVRGLDNAERALAQNSNENGLRRLVYFLKPVRTPVEPGSKQ